MQVISAAFLQQFAQKLGHLSVLDLGHLNVPLSGHLKVRPQIKCPEFRSLYNGLFICRKSVQKIFWTFWKVSRNFWTLGK
jgi:hypothetical protein